MGTERTITYEYASGFLTGVTQGAETIAEVSYHGNAMVNAIAHGNGVTVTYGPDPDAMRRPAWVATLGVSGTPGNWETGAYTYDGAGNVTGIGAQWYVYDPVSRLGAFRWGTDDECPGNNQAGYGYDAFGNRTGGYVVCGAGEGQSVEFTDPATNRLQWATYDAAGNVLQWYSLPGAPVFEYYPGNALRTASGLNLNETYGYTADGERVATYKALEGTNGTYQVTLRDLGGKVLRLFEVTPGALGSWTEKQDWIYRDGQLLAAVDTTVPGGVARHFHLDHLGTPRLVTSATGAGLEVREYRPFGEGATATTGRMRFTGHERDLASGLDSMHARYYNPNVARFLSVDPVRGNPKTPQSWNLYAYVRNNPLIHTDPTGRDMVIVIDHKSGRRWNDPEDTPEEQIVFTAVVYHNTTLREWLRGSLAGKKTQSFVVGITADNDAARRAKAENPATGPHGTNKDTPPGLFRVDYSSGTRGRANGWLSMTSPYVGLPRGTTYHAGVLRHGMSIHPGTPRNSQGCITSEEFSALKGSLKGDLDRKLPVYLIVPDIHEEEAR